MNNVSIVLRVWGHYDVNFSGVEGVGREQWKQ